MLPKRSREGRTEKTEPIRLALVDTSAALATTSDRYGLIHRRCGWRRRVGRSSSRMVAGRVLVFERRLLLGTYGIRPSKEATFPLRVLRADALGLDAA